MQVRSIILALCITYFCYPLQGQNISNCSYSVEGLVMDYQTREPLMFATVAIDGTSTGTTTDEDGMFVINDICEKEFDLVFSYVGYKSLKHHHDFHHPGVEVLLVKETMTLEGIVVEAEAHSGDLATGNSTKLSVDQLSTKSTESLGDIAGTISGVSTISTGQNVVKPVIHGLHSNRILIMNDGLRHEYQNWGRDHAPEIDPSLADQLEVIKGAATVRYGPDALGGVILIKAPDLELHTPFSGKVGMTGKSNGRSGEATLSLQKGFDWISGMVGTSLVKQGDLHTPGYQLTNTGRSEQSYVGGLRVHPLPELDIEARYSHFHQELGILRGSVNGNLEDLLRALEADVPNFTGPFGYDINPPSQDVSHDLFKADVRWIGERQSFQLKFGYQLNKRLEFDVRKGNDLAIPNIDLELRTTSLDGLWRHPSWGSVNGSLGFQWDKQNNKNIEGTNTVPFIPNYDQQRYGVYLIEHLDRGKDLFEIGVRYDMIKAQVVGRQPNNLIYRNDLDYENFSATFGYQRQFEKDHSFQSNIGTAWRPPNVAELYRYGRHLSFLEYGLWRYEINESSDFISTSRILNQMDKPIKPEVGYKWINTWTFTTEAKQWEVVAYVNYVENYVYARPAGITRTVRGTTPFFIYDQTDALLWGIDMSLIWKHKYDLSSNIKGSYLWSQQRPDGDFFVGQPAPRISWELTYQPTFLFFDQTRLAIVFGYTFKQNQYPRIITVDELLDAHNSDLDLFVDDASDFDIVAPPDGYLMTDLSWQSTFKAWTFMLGVRNVFNVRYQNYTDRLRYFADDLGRSFDCTVGYHF